ncbi:MAG TPA: hypothetical protein VKV04_20310 [Verrucomicrobiae bacterium]|nr:hypothetical protein [Verrucomicrobiae bacterium]
MKNQTREPSNIAVHQLTGNELEQESARLEQALQRGELSKTDTMRLRKVREAIAHLEGMKDDSDNLLS